ncbi:MAG: suppressor of fused domain protein [Thermoguttaceae bacterium]
MCYIHMPGNWPVKDEDLGKIENFWPIVWVKAIGRYPHEKGTYYGEKKTVTSKMITPLVTPDNKPHSALVERCPRMMFYIPQDGREVAYYRITPIES